MPKSTSYANPMGATQSQLQTVGDLGLGWDAASKADMFAVADAARKDAARNQARLHAVEDAQASAAIGKQVDTSDAAGEEMEVRTNSDNVTNNYYVQSFDPIQSPTGNTTPTPVVVPPVVVPPSPKSHDPLTWIATIAVATLLLLMLWLAIHGNSPTPPNVNPTPANSGNWTIHGMVQ